MGWVLPCLLLITACEGPPLDKIAVAEQLVKEVQVSGAARYAPQDLVRLQGQEANLHRELLEQESKVRFFRDYHLTAGLASQLEADARQVLAQADRRAKEARAAALQAQSVAQETVKAVQQLIGKSPETDGRRLPEQVRDDANALKKSLREIQRALETADYLTAQATAKAIHDKGKEISEEIQRAVVRPVATNGEKARRKRHAQARMKP